jgi:hypothetical protein
VRDAIWNDPGNQSCHPLREYRGTVEAGVQTEPGDEFLFSSVIAVSVASEES